MTDPRPTTLRRTAEEIVAALADDVAVLNDIGSPESAGGGDVDCAVRGLRPHWHLRLSHWRLCQALRYEATATYFVLDREGETLALDVLEDGEGRGRYRFSTDAAASEGVPGSSAAPAARAAYLTSKRVVKGGDDLAWATVSELARAEPDEYARYLGRIFGDPLAGELASTVLAGVAPSSSLVARAGQQLRRTSFSAAVRGAWWQVGRLATRVSQPTGLLVEVVGPDGSGKSTVASQLGTTCGQLFRRSRHLHFRAGVLPRPGALAGRKATADPTRPHGRPPHGVALSHGLLAYHWLDALLGYVVKVAPFRMRTGLVVIERGYHDISIDPLRYRLSVSPRLVRALGRILPAPDLIVLLEASPQVIAARKDELPEQEITRQAHAWRNLVERHRSVRVDATQSVAAVLETTRACIVDVLAERVVRTLDGGWIALPSRRNPRLYVPRGSRAVTVGGLRAAEPSKTTSRLALAAGGAMLTFGLGKLAPRDAPPHALRALLAPHVPPSCTYAVQRTVRAERYHAVILDRDGSPLAFAKLATDDLGRARLRREAAAVQARGPFLVSPLRAPTLLSASDGVLIFKWVERQRRARPWVLPPEVAWSLGAFYAAGRTGDGPRGYAHGDVSPWNLLDTEDGWILVDWETSFDDAPPFFDVFQYLVQAHTHLGRPARAELLDGVRGRGWVGAALAAYAAGAGVSEADSMTSFGLFLESTSAEPVERDLSPEAVRLRLDLKAELGR